MASRVHGERAEGARIIENHDGAVVQAQRGAGIARGERFRPRDPVPRHPKMRLKHAAVIEIDQLVLSAASNARDVRADQRLSIVLTEPPRQRGMMDLEPGNGTSD